MTEIDIEGLARDSYGRVLAYLASRTRRLEDAEDALSEALVSALRVWPLSGVPDRPEAWLLTVARRRLMDSFRRVKEIPIDMQLLSEVVDEGSTAVELPDERLPLLFLCAHPQVDEATRTPLMLNVVLGLEASRIASAFLVAPSAMRQRLVRAKARLREIGFPMDVSPSEEAARLPFVMEAIYAAFTTGWEEGPTAGDELWELTDEAVHLATLLAERRPDNTEANSLAALCLYLDSRRNARRIEGKYVPLSDQDVAVWDRQKIARAEQFLSRAAMQGSVGRFQLEAAIQSAHAARLYTGRTDWGSIAALYGFLLERYPTVGGIVGNAVARGEFIGPDEGLDALSGIDESKGRTYLPYAAARANLLKKLNRNEESLDWYLTAQGLASDPAVRQYLVEQVNV